KMLTGEWKSNLTPDKLGIVSVDPDSLPINGLRDYIQYLKQNKQESLRYQLIMWNKIFSPLSVAVMMLVAQSFIF
ncbi:MAG: LptF/LptG family permease, partial [Candidatus Regiella insecticola]|nr:LptF/LptG family permease [Candidatus Regiella insecticola]